MISVREKSHNKRELHFQNVLMFLQRCSASYFKAKFEQ